MPRWSIPARVYPRAVTVIASVALVASYVLTWDLWHGRSIPPNLPIVGVFRSVDFGPPLVLAAVLAAVYPRAGAVAHSALLLLSFLSDQIRLQPEFVSLGILLVAAAWPPTSMAIGRWHLITLWAWAGLDKILSRGWPEGGAGFITSSMRLPGLRPVVAFAVPVVEIALGAMALWRRSWFVLRVAGPLFHVGLVVVLVMAHWNNAVWPWNLAIAAAIPFLFASSSVREGALFPHRSRVVAVAAAIFVLYPLGFYFGVSDAYLSHNLYSSNTASASVCSTELSNLCRPAPFSTFESLNVPMPPERRLFVAWFEKLCGPSVRLRIDGIWTRLFERRVEYVQCDRTTAEAPA